MADHGDDPRTQATASYSELTSLVVHGWTRKPAADGGIPLGIEGLLAARHLRDQVRLTAMQTWFLALFSALVLTLASCSSTDAMTHQHHTIDYIEISATDLAVAKAFYGSAFGWKFTDYGPDYCGIQKTGGGEVGGLRQEAEVRGGGPLVVLFSEDLEASLKAVVDAGGKIVVEPFSFPGGRRFQFTDPAGNELAVYSAG